jgi:hypothetical protein
MTLWPSKHNCGGLMYTYADPGSVMGWHKSEHGFEEAYECRITNYGTVPVFDATFVFKSEFRESIAVSANSWEAGPVILSMPCAMEIKRIDSGVGAFVFYITSISPTWVHVYLPTTLSFVLAGETASKTVKLKTASAGPDGLLFSPFRELKQ